MERAQGAVPCLHNNKFIDAAAAKQGEHV